MKVLIIEDELALNKNMVEYLSAQLYLCETVNNYKDALEKIEEHSYDCIILDLMLPDGNGLQLLEYAKEIGREDGIIIISARQELSDKITGLELGADDYLTKPFHLSELSVRVAAIIRRKNIHGNNIVKFEEIDIDTLAKTVKANGHGVSLTRKEYELLLYFVTNRNRVLSKGAIASHLWGDNMDVSDSYDFIYAHVKNLRKKLIQAGAGDYIQSVYGMGYKLSAK